MYDADWEVVYILCLLLSVAEESILNEEKTSDEMKTRIMQGAHSRIDYLLTTTTFLHSIKNNVSSSGHPSCVTSCFRRFFFSATAEGKKSGEDDEKPKKWRHWRARWRGVSVRLRCEKLATTQLSCDILARNFQVFVDVFVVESQQNSINKEPGKFSAFQLAHKRMR